MSFDIKSMVSADLIKDNVPITRWLADHSIEANPGSNIKCILHEDNTPSFSIDKEDALFHCFGCGKGGSVIDLQMEYSNMPFATAIEDLSRNYNLSLPKDPSYTCSAEYIYKDMFDKEKFRVRRYNEPKRFVQGHLKDGIWISNIQGIDSRLPYRLEKWYKSPDDAHKAGPVIIVEGEKDVENVEALGFNATCNAGGAGKFYKEHAKWLENRSVIIIPDNDDAGKLHAAQVIQCIAEFAKEIRLIGLHGEPDKSDITDWIGLQSKPAKALQKMIDEQIPLSREQINSYKSVKTDKRSFTSAGNGAQGGRPSIDYQQIADSFVEDNMIEEVFIYKKHRGFWYKYNGKCYIELSKDDMKAKVMAFIRKMAITDKKFRASTTVRDNVLAHLESDDTGALMSSLSMPMWKDGGDAAGWISLANKIVNIRRLAENLNGEKHPGSSLTKDHTPDYISTFFVDYLHNPKEKCPLWLEYINSALPEDTVRASLQMMFGLCLVPDTSYEVFFLLFGKPGSGKSTALNVLKSMVGQKNCCVLSPDKLREKHSSHKLTEKLVNLVGEFPNTGDLIRVEDKFKDIVSGALIPVEKKYQDVTESHAIARSIFASNHYPEFSDKTGAILQRMRMICFNRAFRDTENQINDLSGKIIKSELSGVFNWAIEGLASLIQLQHFPENPEGKRVKEAEHYKADNEARFLDECCYVETGAFSNAIDLYKKYDDYTTTNGNRSKSKIHFIDRVEIIWNAVKHIQKKGGERGFDNLKCKY